MVCILAGAGWVWLVRFAGERWGPRASAALAAAVVIFFVPFTVSDIRELDRGFTLIRLEADLYGANLKAVIAKAGGEERLKSCGEVYTGPFQTQAVAWYLHLHETDVSIFPMPPGTVIAPHYVYAARDPRFPVMTITSKWMVGSSCGRG
jgi:hypothetical protein